MCVLMHPLAIIVLYISQSMLIQILTAGLFNALYPIIRRLSTGCWRDALVLPTAVDVRSVSVHGPFMLTCQDCWAATGVRCGAQLRRSVVPSVNASSMEHGGRNLVGSAVGG